MKDDLDELLDTLDGKEKAAPSERPLDQEACEFLDASQRQSSKYKNYKKRLSNGYL